MRQLIFICFIYLVANTRGVPLPLDQGDANQQFQNGPHVEAPKKMPNNAPPNAQGPPNEQQQPHYEPHNQQQQQQQQPHYEHQQQQQQQQQQPHYEHHQQQQQQTQQPHQYQDPQQQQPPRQYQEPQQPHAQVPLHPDQQQPVRGGEPPEAHAVRERSPVRMQPAKVQGEENDNNQHYQPGQDHKDNGGQAPRMQQQPPRRNALQTLANDTRCKDDLENIIVRKNLCKKEVLSSNILILDCLQNNLNDDMETLISTECHQAVWDIKHHLTTDDAVHETVKSVCEDVIRNIPECNGHIVTPGRLISCLVEHGDKVHELQTTDGVSSDKFKNCNTLIVRLSSIIFSDYRLVEPFLQDCKQAITNLNCGRTSGISPSTQQITSQDKTLDCLRQKYREIQSQDCKHEILRLAELQADDYHLNRALFYACRIDREKFCARVNAGQGRVYQCLVEHKTNEAMSKECKSHLVNEQELAQEDYRIDVTFARKCNNDLIRHKCLPNAQDGSRVSNEVLMSDIIHCLVSVEKDEEGAISRDCMGAVHNVARQIMEDFKISPSIVSQCKDEIYSFCENNLGRNGSTLQCLLKNAKMAKRNPEQHFSDNCLDQLQEVLEDSDVIQDYTVDPNLVHHCSPVIEKNCKPFAKSGSGVLGCLLEHLGTPAIQEHPECAERVLALYYFVSRNWRMDTALYRSCHQDAVDFCNVKPKHKWHETEGAQRDQASTNSRLVLSCLYNHAVGAVRSRFEGNYANFQKQCVQAISRVMRQRAMDVSLLPEIEDQCMADLATHCSAQTGVGEEMRCLQQYYKKLSEGCQGALRDVMRGSETLDLRIDTVLHAACHPMMESFCANELEAAEHGESEAASSILDCLIRNKHDEDMDAECAVAIEHHQILSVSDTSLNPHFEKACHRDASRFCSQHQESHKVLWCLSELIRNDTLKGKSNFRVSKKCRDRVRFEFFAEMDNVELDSELSDACGSDMRSFCSNIDKQSSPFECLKANWEQLRTSCRAILFQRIQMEAIQGINLALASRCERMMVRHCKNVEDYNMIDCLIEAMAANTDFDRQCRQLVKRAQETKGLDVRLNPGLLMKCSGDIMKYCSRAIHDPFSTLLDSGDAGNGKALNCLRRAYANESIKLNEECANEVNVFIRQSRTNYKQDLLLAKNCKKEIESYCAHVSESQVEECLRGVFYDSFRELPNHKVMSHECTYQVARLLDEAKADVQTDVEVFSACQADIVKFCSGPPGRGRVMGCLLSLSERQVELTPKCHEMVELRRTMWSYAAKEAPPQKLSDVVDIVNESPIKSTVLAVLIIAVVTSILIGIVCGRMTKRVRAEMKNR